MNARFVKVKVDREARPDIDAIFMQAVQALTGQGDWPMTVVLTPDGIPYWGGTYLPKDDRHGMPSFTRVIQTMANAYREQPDAIARTTDAMRALYANSSRPARPSGTVDHGLLERAVATLATRYERPLGGFTGAPKFPQTMGRGGCSIRSAAVFRATAPMPSGWCHTSRRCCTTTPCWCDSACICGRSHATTTSVALPRRPYAGSRAR